MTKTANWNGGGCSEAAVGLQKRSLAAVAEKRQGLEHRDREKAEPLVKERPECSIIYFVTPNFNNCELVICEFVEWSTYSCSRGILKVTGYLCSLWLSPPSGFHLPKIQTEFEVTCVKNQG
jgi:hypothetical protein